MVSGSILAIGLLMIFSTTSAEILDHASEKDTHQAFLRQIYYGFGGLALGLFLFKIGYQKILRLSMPLLILFTFLLILALIPGVGKEVNGSKRWLSIAGFS